MRRLVRLAGLALALLACTQGFADEASNAFKKGTNAEAEHKFAEAYDFYKKACDLKPSDVKYEAACTRMRLYASSQLMLQAANLRDKGRLQEAHSLLQRAVAIDPSNFYAAQELKRTELMIQHVGSPPTETTAQSNEALLSQEVSPPVELHPIPNVPITLRMTEDAKTVYTTIGKLAGLNVLFDPDYTSRRISIDLNGVTLFQALEVVAMESKTFWRPVTPNTIFVAANTPAKRKELEQSVVKTFYLGNVSSPNDLQDAVNTIRQILDVSRIQQIASQSAIVVRGTPDQIAMAQKLLDDIDKAKPEVVVEVAVMQVTRDKIRNLGINPPTSASVSLQSINSVNNNNNNNNNNSGGSSGTTTSGSGLTLNQLANLNANYFAVNIPTASVTALMSDSNTKIIQKPQIRALDNLKATLKIGERIPVATGSFQPGIGGVGINPLVNTQFQYIDVGVNIDITPRIHGDNDVTLKLVLEISNVTGQQNIGGISQPIIGQRRIEQEIRLHNGEVNLLGGILEDADTQSLSGYPGLARIPILRYFFAQSNKERRENEIVFALVPHIVRAHQISALNNTAVDVGTANSIELRHMYMPPPSTEPQSAQPSATPAPPPAGGANAAPAPAPSVQPGVGQPVQSQPPAYGAQPQNAVPVQPGPQQQSPAQPSGATPQAQLAPSPPGQGTLQAGNATLSFEPSTITQPVNSTFVVNLSMGDAQNVYSVPAQISYDPKILQLVNVSNGGLLGKDGQPVALVHRDDPATGTLQVTATRPPGVGGVSGQGPVFSLTFMAKAPGQTTLAVRQASARDPNMQPIPVVGGQAMVTVK